MYVPTITDKMQLILDSYSPFVTEENEVILGLEDAVLFPFSRSGTKRKIDYSYRQTE